MKDHERLDLLKEIGGTRVYEERRKESLKIMMDTGKTNLGSYLFTLVQEYKATSLNFLKDRQFQFSIP